MANKLMPLYYAILTLFLDGCERTVTDVIVALEPLYAGYKLLTLKGVEEALATAKENGLLDESSYRLDEAENLVVSFQVTTFGRNMIERYIGKYSNSC